METMFFLVGGPARGHLYLAGSNVDWGQDMKRLALYAANHPDESIKLLYFGSGDPLSYGFACELLRSARGEGRGRENDPSLTTVQGPPSFGQMNPRQRVADQITRASREDTDAE